MWLVVFVVILGLLSILAVVAVVLVAAAVVVLSGATQIGLSGIGVAVDKSPLLRCWAAPATI